LDQVREKMNLTALIPLLKLLKDAAGPVSPIGPPAPDNGIESICYRADGKLTYACYIKYVDPAASGNDYQDYLTED
jgi:hypothetical protein